MLYVNKPEKRITCQNKTGQVLSQILKPETMRYLGIASLLTCNNISKDKNGKNISHVEITESVLVHCNIVNSDCPHDLKPCTHLS